MNMERGDQYSLKLSRNREQSVKSARTLHVKKGTFGLGSIGVGPHMAPLELGHGLIHVPCALHNLLVPAHKVGCNFVCVSRR